MEKISKATPAKDVDEYLNRLPAVVRSTLENLRQTIKLSAPKAEELISYQIPTYKYKGALVHFAAFENHLSLFVVNKNILNTFSKELQSFKTSGTTIHFTHEHPIPAALVKKIVKVRIAENEERNIATKTGNKIKK